MDTTYLTQSFEEGNIHLKASGMSYAFPHSAGKRPNATRAKKWNVQNWYQVSKQAQIQKHGTDVDKAYLTTFLQQNRMHLHKSRKRKPGVGIGGPGKGEAPS